MKELIDSWLAPDHRYFKFTGSDHGTYIIRHDPQNNTWELTFYKEPPLCSGPETCHGPGAMPGAVTGKETPNQDKPEPKKI